MTFFKKSDKGNFLIHKFIFSIHTYKISTKISIFTNFSKFIIIKFQLKFQTFTIYQKLNASKSIEIIGELT
jgi:hypothetical protein